MLRMRQSHGPSETPTDLVGAIHQVRRRWRYKLMLRGAVGVLGLGALALILSAWGLESWRFSARVDRHLPRARGGGVRRADRLVHRSSTAAGA